MTPAVMVSREHRDEAGPRVRRAAHDLHGIARPGVDRADPEPVGVRVLVGLDHPRDREAAQPLGRVLDTLDLETDTGKGLGDLGQRRLGVEVILEPGEGEFHEGVPGRVLATN